MIFITCRQSYCNISFQCLSFSLGFFIRVSQRFHWEYHYYLWPLSLGISSLSLAAFIRNFIIIPGHFHWEYHYYPWALSLGISLLSLGTFIGNIIIISGHFHWEYHYYLWALSLGISLLSQGISLGIVLPKFSSELMQRTRTDRTEPKVWFSLVPVLQFWLQFGSRFSEFSKIPEPFENRSKFMIEMQKNSLCVI